MRVIACIALWLLVPGLAWGQPASCVEATAAWSAMYPQGNIQAITYYVWQQTPPTPSSQPFLSVLYRSGDLHLHVNVPNNVAQPFASLNSADQRYNGTVKNRYHQALLAETGCPLMSEAGNYIFGEQP